MLHPVSVVVSFSAGFILSGVFALFDHRNPLPQLEAASNSVTVIAQSIDVNRSHKGDHAERNHQGKSNVLLFRRVTQTRREEPVQCRERLGGLLRYYHHEAA